MQSHEKQHSLVSATEVPMDRRKQYPANYAGSYTEKLYHIQQNFQPVWQYTSPANDKAGLLLKHEISGRRKVEFIVYLIPRSEFKFLKPWANFQIFSKCSIYQ